MKPPAQAPAATPQRRKHSVALGGILRDVLTPASNKQGVLLAQLLPFWPSICPLLHQYAVMESLRGSTLTLATTSSSAKQELQYLAPSLIEGANRVLGYAAVREVRCVVRGQLLSQLPGQLPGQPLAAKQPAAKLAQGLPANAQAAAQAAKICQHLPQDNLREALTRLGTLVLNRYK